MLRDVKLSVGCTADRCRIQCLDILENIYIYYMEDIYVYIIWKIYKSSNNLRYRIKPLFITPDMIIRIDQGVHFGTIKLRLTLAEGDTVMIL